MSNETSAFFNSMIDELVIFSQHDQELADSIMWLDEQARKYNVSFYDKCYEVLEKHDIRNEAKRWLKIKNNATENMEGNVK
jgi:hypothetical protein